MYKAILFAPDGANVSDFRDSESVEQVWNGVNDMGSRWIFYPIATVADENDVIVDVCEGILGVDFLKGMSRKNASAYLAEHAKVVSVPEYHNEIVIN